MIKEISNSNRKKLTELAEDRKGLNNSMFTYPKHRTNDVRGLILDRYFIYTEPDCSRISHVL